MKAIMLTRPGTPDEAFEVGQVDTPELAKPHDMLVRLKAAGVNPIDTKLRSRGTYYPEKMPTILGCDGAGVVEAVGSGVSRFSPGDEVYFCNGGIGGHQGNYAEYTTINERFAATKPQSLTFAEAASVPLVLITAWEALFHRARMQADQSILIQAGAGGVGHIAIQLAKLAGCHVATTVGDKTKADFVRGLGADETILYKEVDFAEAAERWNGGGVDIALDTVGGATFQQSFAAIRPYGDLVTLLQPNGDIDWKEARMRNLRTSLELMLSPMYYGWEDAQTQQAAILEQGARLFDEGKLHIHLSHTLPLDSITKAHQLIEAGSMTGKIALSIN